MHIFPIFESFMHEHPFYLRLCISSEYTARITLPRPIHARHIEHSLKPKKLSTFSEITRV